MPDNTTLPPGGGGDTVRTVDRGTGVKTQVVLLDLGGEAGPEQLVDNTTPLPVAQQQLTLRFDDANSPTLYLGEAAPGSAETDPVWRIQRIDTTGIVSFKWAGGSSAFNQVWANRTSLTYS